MLIVHASYCVLACCFSPKPLESCGFKPTTQMANMMLQFIPVNLHMRRLHVLTNLASNGTTGTVPRDFLYNTVTFGCPADHVQGFKNGGLKSILNKCKIWWENVACRVLMSFLSGLGTYMYGDFPCWHRTPFIYSAAKWDVDVFKQIWLCFFKCSINLNPDQH